MITRRSAALVASLNLLLVAACAGSPARIATDTPEQLQAEKTDDLCRAYGGRDFMDAQKNALVELMRRGAIRKDFVAAVQNRQIQIGMNNCEVVSAWQNPQSINRTVTAHGATEQWVYGNASQFVYMENDHVTSFQSLQ